MKLIVWGVILLSSTWVSVLCLAVLLARLQVPWVPSAIIPWSEYVSEPTLFAAWIGLPTLACLGAQIWQVQRVGVEQ